MRLRNLLSTADLDDATLDALLGRARHSRDAERDARRPLAGRTLGMAFLSASARTRACLEEAAAALGVEVRDMTATALSVGRGVGGPAQLARAAACVDALAVRHTRAPGRTEPFLEALAAESACPVLNLQSEVDHPVQTLADLLALQEFAGKALAGRRLAVVWGWQRTPDRPPSVPLGLVSLLPRFGVEVRIAHPPGFELPPARVETARRRAADTGGGRVTLCPDPDAALAGADFVYPQGWCPAGLLARPTEAAALAAPFADWVTDETRLCALCPDAAVLRSLPAAPGEEVAPAVAASPRSLFFVQARNRLAVMRAVLEAAIPSPGEVES